MNSVVKAIIPAGGLGTRFFPIAKAINKCMLPVGDRPLIDYVVEDCIKAGIQDIFFVIRPDDIALKTYYTEQLTLKAELARRGSLNVYEKVADVHARANFHFVEYDFARPDARYGSAIPVLAAESCIGRGERFLVLMGDDFVYNPDGSSETKRLIESTAGAGYDSGLCVTTVPKKDVSRYGVVTFREGDGRTLSHFVEKPEPRHAPSNLANISKYLFHADIMSHLRGLQPDQKSGEYLLTDALEPYCEQHPMYVHEISGVYLDGGNPASLLKANLTVAKSQKQ